MLALVPRTPQDAIQQTAARRREREAQRVEREARPIPANCRRVINTPLPPHLIGYCDAGAVECAGLQRDGTCLAQLVMAAEEQGVEWVFEVNVDAAGNEWWDYIGPPLKPWEPKLPPNVPPETIRPEEPTHFEFTCPHCGHQEIQPVGFWWCGACGKNANDP